MTRVNVVVEGQTEKSFIDNVLAEALWRHEVFLTARVLGIPGKKGGCPNYERLKGDLILLLKGDPTAVCSMMLDLYGLGPDFPGSATGGSGLQKALHIEAAVKADICKTIPEFRPDARFIPYLQLHEFEALLFSAPCEFANAINERQLEPHFKAIRESFQTPEDIDDGPESAPSKRILSYCPRYAKVGDGTRAAKKIGVEQMRLECPHFRSWLEQLESL